MILKTFPTIRQMLSFLFLLDLYDDFFQFLRYFLVVRVSRFHADDSWKEK